MQHLFEKLREDTLNWRNEGYPCPNYPLIGEILRYQFEGEPPEQISLKYLREPQFQSLELYWFLRLVLKTPHIVDLYKHYYSDDKRDFFEAFGIPVDPAELKWIPDIDAVIERIRNDSEFVRQKRIDPVHEAVTLPYPSYIFALAMGTGKTVLIGTIIATEFAMALRYPDGTESPQSAGETHFMRNALVFAPGTTIIESLREISDIPFDQILPTSLHRDFLANLKITYPQAGAKEIQVQSDSIYNVIVTNTEKIALRANVRRRANQTELEFAEKEKQATLEANLRLQKITSLSNLGVFSDEAHHTYGNRMDKELKRVRETVNYIKKQKGVIAVINTTGTPYFKRQMLREVVAWYSLGEGIKDNILKSLHRGIVHYHIGDGPEEEVIGNVIDLFFENYGDVTLPNRSKAKIAFYFKTQEHLDTSKEHIERALSEIGESSTLILVNTQKSSQAEIDEFNRLNDPGSQKRVLLLIGKGVEGWNCPSLFACALIKEQTTSSNFVLQASTRCLRQVEGNTHPAKIFLDTKNRLILDKELEENFGTTLGRLSGHTTETEEVEIRIRKTELPKLEISRLVPRVVRDENISTEIQLNLPTDVQEPPPIIRNLLTPNFTRGGSTSPLTGIEESDKIEVANRATDCYTLARRIGAKYHLPFMETLKELKRLYPEGEVPNGHLYPLFQQVESQLQNYKVIKDEVSEVLALIHTHDDEGNLLFEKDTNGDYIHRLRIQKRNAERMRDNRLLFDESDLPDEHNLSFHYTPYNFDTKPERQFFEVILESLNTSVE
ncbi:MAG: DEAD/DEAH box helicase family protein, partial [Candidatus Poribacteria bacterium]|nr:DEAD/DEAH box helicase family protein [Candidatus Poribacteria bacterium]